MPRCAACAARIMAEHTGACLERIEGLFDSRNRLRDPESRRSRRGV